MRLIDADAIEYFDMYMSDIKCFEKIVRKEQIDAMPTVERKNGMTEKLKELIEKAPVKRKGTFKNLMIVSNGMYDGFGGANGFNSIILLGFDVETEEYVKITEYADVFNIFNIGNNVGFNVDIPNDYEVPRIWFSKPITIDNELNLSSVTGEVEK